MTRRLVAGLLCLVMAAVLWPSEAPGLAEGAGAPVEEPTGRLLVVSMPGLTFFDVANREVPVIREFLEEAALADLAPRGVAARSRPGAAYLTVSAGTRAASLPSVDGQVLALEEQRMGSEAEEIFERRTGVSPDGEFVVLHWPRIVRTNEAYPYDAVLGLLSATLDEAGVRASVIGNADGTDTTDPSFERQVGLALVGPDGVVANGALGPELLKEEPDAPFGLQLDTSAILDSFTQAWGPPSAAGTSARMVVVETSDLARILQYRSKVSRERYLELWSRALADADELFGKLMEEVDPQRDTVLIVAPYNVRGSRNLTLAALRRPGGSPGYLRSASLQRPGFLTLVDVAPTILDVFGIPRPVEMEGRRAEVSEAQDSPEERVEHLVSANQASRFREHLLVPTSLLIVLTMALVAVGTAVVLAGRFSVRWRRLFSVAALAGLAVFPVSYLARAFPLQDLGLAFYWTFLLGGTVLVAVLASAVGARSRHPDAGVVLVLALVAIVLLVDVMTGSRLSLNAAFGYSPTGNSRLYGISNYSFGQVATAVCLLAAFLAVRPGGFPGRAGSVVLLVFTLIVLGVPIWGSDVGGVLAFTPTVLVFVTLLQGRHLRWKTVAAAAGATVLAVAAFGLLDLARPPANRTHLGRLIERVIDEGPGPLYSIVERKLVANLQVSVSSFWVSTIPVAVAFWIFLVAFPSQPLAAIRAKIPTLGAGVTAAFVAAVLGSLVNDSGAIVGGVAASVLTMALAHLALEHSSTSSREALRTPVDLRREPRPAGRHSVPAGPG